MCLASSLHALAAQSVVQTVAAPTSEWLKAWYVAYAVLEVLYFLSTIGLFAVACYGLKQLTLSKQLADANSKREAVRLAANQCKYFAEEVVLLLDAAIREYKQKRATFLTPPQQPAYLLKDGEFVQANYNGNLVAAEWPVVADAIVKYLNSVESFAIPFAAGVAADDIGFQETSASFCSGLSYMMPAIYHLRVVQNVKYPSALKLFCIWNNRMAANAMTPVMRQMQELIKASEKNKIEPL